jgi:hypothetical protein
MFCACVHRAILRDGKHAFRQFMRVRHTTHAPFVARVAVRTVVLDRVILAPKNERRKHDVDFHDQGFV